MLARDYRKADEINSERRNQELWLQGMYIYDAILCASPILHAFAKKGTKAKPYPEHPYAITVREVRREKKAKAKMVYEKGIRYMDALTANINKKFHPQQKDS